MEGRQVSDYEYADMQWQVDGAREPLSPHMLAQELVSTEWQAVVASYLCVRATRSQSHVVLWRLLGSYPTYTSMAFASMGSVANLVRPCGLHNKRAKHLITMSKQWMMSVRPYPPGEYGIRSEGAGKYIQDSYRIFVLGDLTCGPYDEELRKFVVWAFPRKKLGLPWRPDYGTG